MSLDRMLSDDEREVQQRARTFVDEVLIPLEVTAELAGGPLPEADIAHVRARARELELVGDMYPPEFGGQGWTTAQWYLAEEQ
ncbi:MAG TPA: acyl-CoA dehydrogenase family protein, partial [Actinomycetes bacterium]|nr:acyl-CoA dehydrogenase family protein [Actinomycetes bacterium]